MTPSYPTAIWVHLESKGYTADGFIEVVLPYPPFVSMYVDGITIDGIECYVETVRYSVQVNKTIAVLADVVSPDQKIGELIKLFVGAWDWNVEKKAKRHSKASTEDTSEPETTLDQADEESIARITEILKKRNGDLKTLLGQDDQPKEK